MFFWDFYPFLETSTRPNMDQSIFVLTLFLMSLDILTPHPYMGLRNLFSIPIQILKLSVIDRDNEFIYDNMYYPKLN